MSKELSIVEHVIQTEKLNCVSACLAMVTGLPVEKVTEEFHEDYINNKVSQHDFLNQKGVSFTRLLANTRNLESDKVYLASVPSLNIVGALHQIVIETTMDGGLWWIFDPNNGRKDRKCYVAGKEHELDENYISVKAYSLEYMLDRNEVIRLIKENS